MGRKKTKTMPILEEEKAPVRVSKRASTSQFATNKVQKVEKLFELENNVTKTPKKGEASPPPLKTARRSSSKTKTTPGELPKPAVQDEVEKSDQTLDSVNAQVPKTLEEMKRIIGADLYSPPVEKTPKKQEESVSSAPSSAETEVSQPQEPKKVIQARKGRPPKSKVDVAVPVEMTNSMDTIAERAGKRQKKEKVIFDPSDLQVRIRKRAKLSTGDESKIQHHSQAKTPNKSDSKKSPHTTPVSPKKLVAPTTPPRRPTFDTTKLTMIKQKFGQFCYVCLSGKGNLEQTCPRCGSRVHNKCLEEQKYLTSVRILGAANWLCQNCCECCVCHTNSVSPKNAEDEEIFVCVTCKQFYHAHCHRPSLTNKPIMKATWKCHACAEKCREQRHNAKIQAAKVVPVPPSATKLNGSYDLDLSTVIPPRSRAFTQHKSRNIALKLPPRLNQLNEWTVDEVYKYFSLHFPDHAALFRDQEIDGAVLLLMRRSDVLQGFGNIKLGTAINIYRHIVMMQTKSNDPRQTWY